MKSPADKNKKNRNRQALVTNPSLVLADEPTGNLDSHTTDEILNVLEEIHQEGNTVVLITHEDSCSCSLWQNSPFT